MSTTQTAAELGEQVKKAMLSPYVSYDDLAALARLVAMAQAAQRVPLSDAQVLAVYESQEGFYPDPLLFARAIEAAERHHGIAK